MYPISIRLRKLPSFVVLDAPPTVDTSLPPMDWFQPWSEPVRPLTGADVAKIRSDERAQAKTDQTTPARAARAVKDRPLLAVIRQQMATGDPRPDLMLKRVNKHLRRLKLDPIGIWTLRRRLKKLKK